MIDIKIIPVLEDNYCYVITDINTQISAIIDPGDSAPIIGAVKKMGIQPRFIINTHFHWDHTDGNLAVKEAFDCKIVGPAAEADKIPGIDVTLADGQIFTLGNTKIKAVETPGHTLGHICLWIESEAVLFSGDTLFSMATGRLFEGTAEQMFQSLSWIKSLPPQTQIYFGHEYTMENAEFSLTVEPDNLALQKRYKDVCATIKSGGFTSAVSLQTELETNLMLNAQSAEAYGTLRAAKDNYD